tara:strand:+ start:1254 stop:1961 length:708 start_codon:yes stop_codon:yes gene_type:complete
MANTAVSGTLFCSDGTEIPLFVAAIAEGTESNLTTNTTNNFTVSASAVGTAFAGKQVVASSPIMGDGDGNTTCSYAYILRAGTILSILPVGLAGIVDQSRMPIPKPVVLQAGDQVRVMMNASTDRECALSVYTNRGECHIFAVTPSGAATNQLVSILTGNGIGETLQGQSLTMAFATSIDRVKLAPSGMGVYVVDDKNNIVGAIVATAPSTQQVRFNSCNIPIGLNFQAQAITSS